MLDLNNLHRPRSAEEAVRALLETEGTGLYVAGGTIVIPTGSPSLNYLVDLGGTDLDYITVEDNPDDRLVVVGATTTMTDLVLSPELSSPALRALREAALEVGTHTIRNRATVGGNLYASHFPSDLPPVLVALDAGVILQGTGGPREVKLVDFYSRRAEVYNRGDLIVEVRVPTGSEELSSAFEKTGRTRVDVAIANCAAAVEVKDGTIETARIVVSGVASVPFVAEDAAESLVGTTASAEALQEAGALVSKAISPRGDHRASADYRRKVAGVLASRAVARAAGVS